MCGIVGLLDFAGPSTEVAVLLDRMNAAQLHRGPDGAGVWIAEDRRGGIGMTRLSIVDPAGGRQPFLSEDGQVIVVCNGEIYNHRALRRELEQRGHRFRSRSDCEVIVHLYEDLGVECLTRLDGMFALAIVDLRNNQIWLARDRVGMKHLYFAETDRGFLFASEMRALLASGLVATEPAVEHFDAFLQTGFIPAPLTALRGIRRIPAGHRLLRAGGATRLEAYWEPRFQGDAAESTEVEQAQRLETLLRQAVASHLDADVPVGVFLSGGWDSSLVAVLAAQERREPLATFSLVFPDNPADNEASFSQAVARQIGSQHTEIEIRPQQVWDVLTEVVSSVEDLCSGTPGALVYQLARTAAQDLKVVIGGEGADELFAGYPRTQPHPLDRWRAWCPPLLGRVAPYVSKTSTYTALRILTDRDPRAAHRAHLGPFPPAMLRRLLRPEFAQTNRQRTPFPIAEGFWRSCRDVVEERLCVDMAGRLPDCLLLINDKVTMAHSLEVRMPFLDRSVVDFALSLPSSLKSRDGQAKYLLSRLTGHLPAALRGRKKQGLAIPYKEFFQSPSGQRIVRERLLDGPAAGQFFRRSELERWIDSRLTGKLRDPWLLWRLLYLSAWWEDFVLPRRERSPVADSPRRRAA